MLGSMKFTHIIMALLMSMVMMFSMTGAATAAGCSNPTHQHYFIQNSTEATPMAIASTGKMTQAVNLDSVSVANKETDNISSYNKTSSHRLIADGGPGYLYKRSHSGTVQHSNRHVLAVAFKHRSPTVGWEDSRSY